MNKRDQNKSPVAYEEIARLAYQLWEAAGRPEGCAVQHWLEAEATLRSGGRGTVPIEAGSKATRSEPGLGIRYGLVLGPEHLKGT